MNIAKAHAYCTTLPGATRDIKWAFQDSAHAVFSVGGKMFAMFNLEKDKLVNGLSFKADDSRFLELTDRPGIIPAPYLARARWVKLEDMKALTDAEARTLLADAHRTVFAKLTKKSRGTIDPQHLMDNR